MADELRANQSKGDRTGERGWLTATRKDMDYELFDHAAKLHTSRRALERAELDYSVPKHEVDRLRKEVREHAADVANVALIIADCARAL